MNFATFRRKIAETERQSPMESDAAKRRIGILSREYRVTEAGKPERHLMLSPSKVKSQIRSNDNSVLSQGYRSRKRLSLPPIFTSNNPRLLDDISTERTMQMSPSRLLMQLGGNS